MSGVVRSVMIRMAVDNSQAVRAPKEVADSFEKSATRIERAGRRTNVQWGKVNETVGRGARNAFLVGAAGLAYAETKIVKFDKAMSGVDAATHETAANMGRLREASIQAGADTAFSATEAAQGVTELAKAGVVTADILGGGLRGALDLAAAGQISVAEAGETAASAMTQFALKGDDVTHIADLLAAGAGKAQGSVHDLGMALNQSGLVASQAGLSIEDTTGTLAAFAKNGLIGSDAGTSFKTMLLSLNPRSKEAAKLMKDLNIEAYDAKGNFVGITEYAGKLREGLKGLTDEQRAGALKEIFGADAIRAANILYREGSKGIEGWIRKVDDSGYAADTAARQLDNLSGDVEKLTGSLETAFIRGGSGAQDGLRDLVQGAERLVDKFNELPASVQGNVVKAVAGLTLLAGGVAVVSKALGAVQTIRGGFAAKGGALAAGAKGGVIPVFVTNPGFGGGVGGVAGKAGTVASGAAAGAGATSTLGKAGGFLSGIAKSPLMKKAGWVGLALGVAGAGKTFLDADRKSVGFVDALQDLAEGSPVTVARLGKISDAMQKNTKSSREVTDAMHAAANDNTGAAMFNAGYQAMSVLTPMAGKYAKTLKTIPTHIRSYVSTPGAITSQRQMASIQRQYNLTPRQVRTIMLLQGFSETQARIAAAGAAYRRLPKQVKTAINTPGAIKSEADVERLQRRYKLTPAQKNTVMRVSGVDAAIAKTRALQLAIAAVRSKSVTIRVVRAGNPVGGITAQADGGPIVAGPGQRRGPRDDDVLIAASHREFMQPVAAVDYYGEGFMEAVRQRRLPKPVGYAGGGSIGRAGAGVAVAPSLASSYGRVAVQAPSVSLAGAQFIVELGDLGRVVGRIVDVQLDDQRIHQRNLARTNR